MPEEAQSRFSSRAEALQAVRTLIAYIGDDPGREGLQDTPERFLKAWRQDWGSGYAPLSEPLVKLFEAEPPHSRTEFDPQPPMIIMRGLNVHSHCEHHLAPFFGTCDIAYIPDHRGKLGLSKFARIVNHFAQRLQIQERLTDQIADCVMINVSNDVAVTMRCRHMCMISRGVYQSDSLAVTSALRGRFFDLPSCRDEYFRLIAK